MTQIVMAYFIPAFVTALIFTVWAIKLEPVEVMEAFEMEPIERTES